jgi:hypothetical protein
MPLGFHRCVQNPNSVIGTRCSSLPQRDAVALHVKVVSSSARIVSESFPKNRSYGFFTDPYQSFTFSVSSLSFAGEPAQAASSALGCEEWREEYDYDHREANVVMYVVLPIGECGGIN